MATKHYQQVTKQALSLIESEPNLIANLANISALLNMSIDDINWVGFYLISGDELVLGPFQGKPACVRIQMGKGVCGTAAKTKGVQRIANVHDFSGHIACDAETNSEIVIPFFIDNELVGVLDIDSTKFDRFDQDDEDGLVYLLKEVEKLLNSHANA